MEFEENERIIIPDESGEERLFEVLFYFDIEETKGSYIITAPVEQDEDEDGGIEVYAFRYEEDKEDEENGFQLFPIESDKEWELVEEMFFALAKVDE